MFISVAVFGIASIPTRTEKNLQVCDEELDLQF